MKLSFNSPIMLKKSICPFCFNYFRQPDYCCISPRCCPPGETVYRIPNAAPDRDGFVKCDKCKQTTQEKICPECGKRLPYNILKNPTKIISIVGAPNSGKSYFVGSLIRQLDSSGIFSKLNGTSVLFAGKQSREEYEIRFRRRMDSHIPLDATKYADDIIAANPPILMEFTNRKIKNAMYTISFFDAAGENFTDDAVLSAITPYISHSEAIIFILDPRQIPDVDAKVTSAIPNLPASNKYPFTDILSNTINVIRNQGHITGVIDIPICIAVSKWDLLINTPGLIDPGFSVSKPPQIAGGYDDAAINQASEEIKSLLNSWDPSITSLIDNNFNVDTSKGKDKVRYFGFSAVGSPVTQSNVPPIAPFRVEDPLFWILHRDKLV